MKETMLAAVATAFFSSVIAVYLTVTFMPKYEEPTVTVPTQQGGQEMKTSEAVQEIINLIVASTAQQQTSTVAE